MKDKFGVEIWIGDRVGHLTKMGYYTHIADGIVTGFDLEKNKVLVQKYIYITRNNKKYKGYGRPRKIDPSNIIILTKRGHEDLPEYPMEGEC